MNLLREYIRGLLIEQEEEEPELSELDKIKEIFAVNGAQAVELGEMLLPDTKEIGMMKRAVRVVREFLELFEKPAYEASTYDKRLRARDTFYYDMNQTLKSAIPDIGREGGPVRVQDMYYKLGRIYKDLEGIIGFKKLEDWLPDIEAAAEWAGAPMPKIPEVLQK